MNHTGLWHAGLLSLQCFTWMSIVNELSPIQLLIISAQAKDAEVAIWHHSVCHDVNRGLCGLSTGRSQRVPVLRAWSKTKFKRSIIAHIGVARGQRGHAPQISSISCRSVLRHVVSQTKYCCPLKFKIFAPPKTFGLVTLLAQHPTDLQYVNNWIHRSSSRFKPKGRCVSKISLCRSQNTTTTKYALNICLKVIVSKCLKLQHDVKMQQ